jgi:glycerol-3-phosphate dehydrogenase (NAD(P)+)
MNSVMVVGAGAWGTALALQAHRAGREVTLWARDPARAAAIGRARENPRLPGIVLPPDIVVSDRLVDADLIVLATPLQHLRAAAAALPDRGALLCCAKGVEAASRKLPLEILADVLPERPAAILTGPNFAHEIAAGHPAAAVIAARDAALRASVIAALATPGFRLYGNDDPIGAQVGGAAKNVIAIAAGAVIGAGLGENARAALVTRGLAELARLAVASGGNGETVAGLSGLGDLLLTCTGASSRNFRFGHALGAGGALSSLASEGAPVVEGVATAPAIVARAAAAGVTMPICEVVAAIVTGAMTIPDAMAALLARPRRDE